MLKSICSRRWGVVISSGHSLEVHACVLEVKWLPHCVTVQFKDPVELLVALSCRHPVSQSVGLDLNISDCCCNHSCQLTRGTIVHIAWVDEGGWEWVNLKQTQRFFIARSRQSTSYYTGILLFLLGLKVWSEHVSFLFVGQWSKPIMFYFQPLKYGKLLNA